MKTIPTPQLPHLHTLSTGNLAFDITAHTFQDQPISLRLLDLSVSYQDVNCGYFRFESITRLLASHEYISP